MWLVAVALVHELLLAEQRFHLLSFHKKWQGVNCWLCAAIAGGYILANSLQLPALGETNPFAVRSHNVGLSADGCR